MHRLSNGTTSLYSDLLQKSLDQGSSVLDGSFVSKTIKGSRYWYHQGLSVDQSRRQKCVGLETPALVERMSSSKHRMLDRKRIVAMLGAGGAYIEKGVPFRILSRLHELGVFESGGVLIGSFAYSCYGNMLGVSLDKSLMRTEDMDISADRVIDIGLSSGEKFDISSSFPGFFPPPSERMEQFSLIDRHGFKIEFLTTKKDQSEKSPVLIERFGIFAQPLDFMDYLIESSQKAVILSGIGVPVAVPDPARFALHKLAISQLRQPAEQLKTRKDILQAESILSVLLEDNEGSILLAVDAIMMRNDLFANFVRAGANKMSDVVQERFAALTELPIARWNTSTGTAEVFMPQGQALPHY